jgi:hypothetical protein
MTDSPPPEGKVRFAQHHLPALDVGKYRLTVSQTIATASGDGELFKTDAVFWVGGERFRLDPAEIDSVFPPSNSQGEFHNVLPHVVLTRPMLPWERNPTETIAPKTARGDVAPWLALLVFDQDDPPPKLQSLTIGDLRSPKGAVSYPMKETEVDELDSTPCAAIDVDAQLLKAIAPTLADLPWLASVRSQTALTPGSDPDPVAEAAGYSVIVANRLPRMGVKTTVHLVSLEGMGETLAGVTPATTGAIRLASLFSWSFDAIQEPESFASVFVGVGADVKPFGLPSEPGTLEGDDEVRKAMALGYVALGHDLRDGGRTVSWYRGPFAPLPIPRTMPLFCPLGTADAALRYNPDTSLMDASYAAAWQLGRMMALQSKDFSTQLSQWKHAIRREAAEQAEHDFLDQRIAIDTDGPAFARRGGVSDAVKTTVKALLSMAPVPVATPAPAPPPASTPETGLSAPMAAWMRRLETLHGVPFRYLVPYGQMLPLESIRFFHLDRNWADALLDGAFSLGSATMGDLATAHTTAFKSALAAAVPEAQPVTGFLLRSRGVAQWPNLQASPRGKDGKPLDIIRYERISAEVLLCLMDGVVDEVDIHQPPEGMHFGFDISNVSTDPSLFFKKLRDPLTGRDDSNAVVSPIPYRSGSAARGVVDIDAFAGTLESRALPQLGAATPPRSKITSAEFSLLMVEGVGLVTFTRHPDHQVSGTLDHPTEEVAER